MAAGDGVDICVIGAGSGGLSVAAGASQMGARTLLIERGRMGGDCLNTGCVPSKALLAAAHAAENWRQAERFGITGPAPSIDFARVNDHVKAVIAAIEPNDSVARFTGLGVEVIAGTARFVDRTTVAVGERRIRARRFVIATGSAPLVPPIPGLDGVDYLTNETIFDLRQAPRHLIVIGGGPIGLELGQAHRRLGAAVTIVEMASILPKDDPEAVGAIREQLLDDGVALCEGARVTAVARADGGDGGVRVTVQGETGEKAIDGSHLLLAVGRRANIEALDLDAAGIAHGAAGIAVDARLRTTNRKVFAIGDVAGGLQFTHVAGYHAGVVIKNALFRLPAKASDRATPWVTFTEPELAHVGLDEARARAKGSFAGVLRWPLADNDRAQAERTTAGMIKVITGRRGRILGATIVGAHAGELIQPWVLALHKGLKIGDMASMVAPYPTLGEIGKRAASSHFTPSLFSERTKSVVRFLARFG